MLTFLHLSFIKACLTNLVRSRINGRHNRLCQRSRSKIHVYQHVGWGTFFYLYTQTCKAKEWEFHVIGFIVVICNNFCDSVPVRNYRYIYFYTSNICSCIMNTIFICMRIAKYCAKNSFLHFSNFALFSLVNFG